MQETQNDAGKTGFGMEWKAWILPSRCIKTRALAPASVAEATAVAAEGSTRISKRALTASNAAQYGPGPGHARSPGFFGASRAPSSNSRTARVPLAWTLQIPRTRFAISLRSFFALGSLHA